jgi:hypothetical protein
MSKNDNKNKPAHTRGEILVYQTGDGHVKLDVRLEDETVWLTQQMMAELFQTTKQNIGQHLKNIFEEGELDQNSVVKKFFTTAADGKNYKTNFYNLDAVISAGYRIKSLIAARFRIWAAQRLKEYINVLFLALKQFLYFCRYSINIKRLFNHVFRVEFWQIHL